MLRGSIPFLSHARRDPSYQRTGALATRDYLVIYEPAEDGNWGAHRPDVDGVFALGVSRDEVESRMREALAAHLAYLRERGKPIPEPRTDAGRVAG
jgi:predicted RNase H-like HicB family nuclease